MTELQASRDIAPGQEGLLHLAFDDAPNLGACDHYFHFLLGYALPALNLVKAEGLDSRAGFVDCGPVMNVKLAEACAMVGVPCRITPAGYDGETSVVQRWDKWLRRPDGSAPAVEAAEAFRRMSGGLRDLMLARARAACELHGRAQAWQAGDVLVIRRSPPHVYYAVGGGCRVPGYGTERRSMENSAEIARALVQLGYPAKEICPGEMPLWEQIHAFSQASCVVGARGAEFANLLWMRPESSALMFATPLRVENHMTRTMAAIFGIRFFAPPVASVFFSGDVAVIEGYLRAGKVA